MAKATVSKGPHPEVASKPCSVCGKPATKNYDCADCKKPCCPDHMNWASKGDKKWRCPTCFAPHRNNYRK